MAWNYNKDVSEFEIIPEGKYRIRIKNAELTKSKSSGNDMVKVTFEVSGHSGLLFYYIVHNYDNPDQTNRMLKAIYKSFAGITEGDQDLRNWIGKVGACTVKHQEYNGQMTAKVGYLIPADKQKDLPAWQNTNGTTVDSAGYVHIPDGVDVDVPFT